MVGIGGQSFDGGYFFIFDLPDRGLAGAGWLTVDVNGAGSALGDATTVFGSGEANYVAERPKKGHVGVGFDGMWSAVNI